MRKEAEARKAAEEHIEEVLEHKHETVNTVVRQITNVLGDGGLMGYKS